MKQLEEQVRRFMTLASQPIGAYPGDITEEMTDLGLSLIDEEWMELCEAVAMAEENPAERKRYLAEVADALGDLLYVTTWLGLAYGFPMVEVLEEIQRTNLAKFGPGARKDPKTGKQLKPPGWTPPDIQSILFPPET